MTRPASPETGETATAVKQAFVFPASFAQRRLWFLHQFDPLSSAYNIPAPLRLNAPVDRGALERALREIVRRHESLRTTFTTIDGEPMQVVAPAQTFDLEYVDLRALPAAEREAEAHRLAVLDAQRPFSLTRGPLLRATLIQLGQGDYVLLLTMHHIVSDGWSMGVLLRELSALYGAYSVRRPSPLAELPIQYADFAQWQRETLQGEFFDELLGYWKTQLAGTPGLLALPTDRPRPAAQTYRGGLHAFTLEPQLYEAVRALSRRAGVTPFMTLLAAFKALLWRHTSQPDVVVGTPIANRTRVEVESLIGFFVNTLVLRTDLSGDPTFGELLGRVREVTLGAYAHQDMPFEKLVEELQPERDLSHNPLFQVMFIFNGAENGSAQQPSGEGGGSPLVSTSTAKFDLTLSMAEANRTVSGGFEYNTDLFDPTTVERLATHFERILRSVVRRPEERLSQLPLFSEDERRQLLVEWNQTGDDYRPAACVHELFERQVERTPEAVALVSGVERLTYAELNARSEGVARVLRRIGVGEGALVGLCLARSAAMVVGVLGVLKAGGAYVPLDPCYPLERLRWMAEDAGLRAVLTQESLRGMAAELGAPEVVCVEDASPEAEPAEASRDAGRADAESPAYVIYTSGSTGRPKGVVIPHRAVHNLLVAMRREPGIGADDVLLSVTTLSFDIAGLEIFLPLVEGARVVIAGGDDVSDARRLTRLLADSGATLMQATPSMWRLLIDAGWRADGRLKILCGGEALSRDLADELLECCGELWNMYGPTETTIWSMTYRVGEDSGPVPIGRPIANTQAYILDAHAQPTPVGVVGELYLGGDGLAHGYLNRPGLTAERFVPNPFSSEPGARLYRTGDLARYLPDGRVAFLGRADHQVKVRGHRIEPAEVAAALREQPGVREALVVASEDEPGDQRLVAYVVEDGDGESISVGELRSALKAKLPDYMVPSHFVPLKALPLLPNGKINRRALPRPDGSPARGQLYVAPRTTDEQHLARLVGEILRHERVGVHDDFFDLGGHSLLATRLVSRIEEAFGVAVPLRRFFEGPTVEALASFVAENRSAEGAAVPAPIRRRDEESAAALSDVEVESLLERLMDEEKEHR